MHRTPGNPHIDHNIYHKMSLVSRIEGHRQQDFTSRWVFPPGGLEFNQIWKYIIWMNRGILDPKPLGM